MTSPAQDTKAPRTLIVVPAFNEGKRLDPEAFLEALEDLRAVDLLFVNDGSTDDTAEVVEAMKAKGEGRIFLLNLERNGGKAEAVRRGFLHGFERDYRFFGYWDADRATPLSAARDLLGEFKSRQDVAAVLGSRVRLLGREIHRKAHRHYMGRVFATFVSLALDLGVYDTQCGAKIFRDSPALRACFESPFVSRWIFDVEILARLRQGGLDLEAQVVEFPLHAWIDVNGSKLRAKDFVRAVWDLNVIFWSLRTGRSKLRPGK